MRRLRLWLWYAFLSGDCRMCRGVGKVLKFVPGYDREGYDDWFTYTCDLCEGSGVKS